MNEPIFKKYAVAASVRVKTQTKWYQDNIIRSWTKIDVCSALNQDAAEALFAAHTLSDYESRHPNSIVSLGAVVSMELP